MVPARREGVAASTFGNTGVYSATRDLPALRAARLDCARLGEGGRVDGRRGEELGMACRIVCAFRWRVQALWISRSPLGASGARFTTGRRPAVGKLCSTEYDRPTIRSWFRPCYRTSTICFGLTPPTHASRCTSRAGHVPRPRRLRALMRRVRDVRARLLESRAVWRARSAHFKIARTDALFGDSIMPARCNMPRPGVSCKNRPWTVASLIAIHPHQLIMRPRHAILFRHALSAFSMMRGEVFVPFRTAGIDRRDLRERFAAAAPRTGTGRASLFQLTAGSLPCLAKGVENTCGLLGTRHRAPASTH